MNKRVGKLREKYANYGKVSGYLKAYELGLPTSKTLHGATTREEVDEICETLGSDLLTCRPDAPFGKGNNLPRGRDLPIDEIPSFLETVKAIRHDAILAISLPPAVEVTGEYTPRYKVSGGVMAIINFGESVDIEYVGTGFDVGELTRGKEVHSSISIPYEYSDLKPLDIMRHLRLKVFGHKYDISSDDYHESRTRRIIELTTKLDENHAHIGESIPKTPTHLSPLLFQKLYRTCIQGIMYARIENQLDTLGVMMNIYGDTPYVFEIWNPNRSLIK